MTVVNALELARSYGVRFLRKPDGGIRYQAAAAPPPDVVSVLAAAKPDFLRVLAGREAAKIATNAEPPPDCLPQRWTGAQDGLGRFVADGWGEQASLLGWSVDELYRVPPVWARVDLCGAALLIGDREVAGITPSEIRIKTASGSSLAFYRKPAVDYALAYRERIKMAGEDAHADGGSEEIRLRAVEAVVNIYRSNHPSDTVDTAKAAVLDIIHRSSTKETTPNG
jgi:hypothetical protein